MTEASKRDRVAIYNRWWNTAGGGEKHAGAIAEVLSHDHQVTLLTHEPVDLATIAAQFQLDLAGVAVRYVADSASAVSQASAEYDLFINASHLDYVAPRARRNALVVYFPSVTVSDARALAAYNRAKGLVLAVASRVLGPSGISVIRRLAFASAAQSSDQTWLGRAVMGGISQVTGTGEQKNQLDGYEVLLAISEYTRRWILQYWKRDCFVLYPRVPASRHEPREKRPSILTVGRFFAGNHNKKQVELIRAFQSIRNELPGWRLHVAGGFRPTSSNLAYLRSVEAAAAADDRVVLHVNCSAVELAALYRESRLYWHATGLGENSQAHPERFEHFGITVVEAMAAGCVPLVLDAGGLPEIVRPSFNGMIWNGLAELKQETMALSNDSPRWERLSQGAIERAADFDGPAFEHRLGEALRLIASANARSQ